MKLRVIIGLLAACSFFIYSSLSAQNIRKTLDLDKFDAIGLGISADVYLTPGNTQKVEVEGRQDIIELLDTDVDGDSWNIRFTERNVRNYGKIKFYITLPGLSALSIGGSGKIATEQAFNGLDELQFSVGGSGTIEFAGSVENLSISIGGSGSIKGRDLKAENCSVSIGGSGDAYVEVQENLQVSIAGSGSVYYSGRPRLNTSIAGSGKVKGM